MIRSTIQPTIPATLPAAAAGGETWDGLVIGSGPAGAAAALRLVRLGWRVLLVDRCDFPRPKVCGSCLSAAAVAELTALDLPQDSLPPFVPLDVVRLVAAGQAARVRMPAGATMSRDALDAGLVGAAIAAGVAWLPQLTVTAIDVAGDGTAAVEARPAGAGPVFIRARCAVIAAGLPDAIRVTRAGVPLAGGAGERRPAGERRIGVGATLPAAAADLSAGELVMAVSRGGYVGIVRLEDGRIDVAAAVAPAVVAAAGSPAAAITEVLAAACGPAATLVDADALHTAHVRATPPLTHRSALTAGGCDAVLRLGDAAAYVEPFTGEGIGWALASARVFADAAAGTACPATRAARYRSGHTAAFTARHARCRGVALAVRHPRLIVGVVRMARIAPRVAAGVLPWIVGAGRLS